MWETTAYVIGSATALLALDAALARTTRRPAPRTTAARAGQGARVLALLLLASSLANGCRTGESLGADLAWTLAFGLVGLVGLELADRMLLVVLRGLDDAVREGNLAAGIAAAAHTASVGLLVATIAVGRSFADLAVALGAFATSQTTLVVLVAAFRRLTGYDDRAQVLRGNVAAGLSHGGLTLAVAIVVAHAADGEFLGLVESLQAYGFALAECLVLWPLRQLLVQCVLLHARPSIVGGEVDRRIADGDVGVGALEAMTYVGFALLLVRSAA